MLLYAKLVKFSGLLYVVKWEARSPAEPVPQYASPAPHCEGSDSSARSISWELGRAKWEIIFLSYRSDFLVRLKTWRNKAALYLFLPGGGHAVSRMSAACTPPSAWCNKQSGFAHSRRPLYWIHILKIIKDYENSLKVHITTKKKRNPKKINRRG